MKPDIENLKVWMSGRSTTGYQRALGMIEFEKLLDYVAELEQLRQPVIMLSLVFLFAQWIGERQYSKHQCNDRWYDNGDYVGTTEDIWIMFEKDTDWHKLKKPI